MAVRGSVTRLAACAEALASAPRSSGRWALVNKFKDAIQESARPPLGGSDTWSRVAVDACATGGHENGIGLARLMGRAIMTGPRDTAWGLRSVQIHGVLAHPLGVGTPMGATGWGHRGRQSPWAWGLLREADLLAVVLRAVVLPAAFLAAGFPAADFRLAVLALEAACGLPPWSDDGWVA